MCNGNRPSCRCPDAVSCDGCDKLIVISDEDALRCPACRVALCEPCYDTHVYSDPCFAAIRPAAMRVGRR